MGGADVPCLVRTSCVAPASAIDAIMGAMKFRKYVDGDVVCKQGDDADFFAIIITGSCYIALNGGLRCSLQE